MSEQNFECDGCGNSLTECTCKKPSELIPLLDAEKWQRECNNLIDYYTAQEGSRAELRDYENAIKYRDYVYALMQLRLEVRGI